MHFLQMVLSSQKFPLMNLMTYCDLAVLAQKRTAGIDTKGG